jgi:hypothetical protein
MNTAILILLLTRPWPARRTSEKAIQLVTEFGAQGALVQVMQAAKEVLERELRDLEAEGDEEFETQVAEDPAWRERL